MSHSTRLYSEDQPRDDHGRFGEGGGGDKSGDSGKGNMEGKTPDEKYAALDNYWGDNVAVTESGQTNSGEIGDAGGGQYTLNDSAGIITYNGAIANIENVERIGSSRASIELARSVTMQTCPNCGADVLANAKTCPECGMSMSGMSIVRVADNRWELRDGAEVLGSFEDGVVRTGYEIAALTLGELMSQAETTSGLLPEGFVSPALAVSEKLPGGRDFTNTAWSWRDPQASLVPLFLQTKNEGHDGADLVGFFTDISMDGTTVTGRGRLYDTEMGQMARDFLRDGRPFGVSVDPSENLDVEVVGEFDGEMSAIFHAYEIAGATMHPVQGFDAAHVLLDATPEAAVPVRASAPTGAPSRALLTRPEPPIDELVEQVDKAGNVLGMAYPLTITDVQEDGYRYAYAHLTYWTQCHIGNPWGAGRCASAQPSETGYAEFHTGETAMDDGKLPTGRLVVGCEHSDAMDCAGVRDHLAHAGMGWASAHVVDGEFGPWMCAVLDPSLTDQQIALLRSLSLSGEWVGELSGILSVNASGLPVQRQRLAASGLSGAIPQAAVRASVSGGVVTKLIGANVVGACPECEKRRLAASAQDPVLAAIADLAATVRHLDLRTRHLIEPAAEDMIRRLAASAKNGQT